MISFSTYLFVSFIYYQVSVLFYCHFMFYVLKIISLLCWSDEVKIHFCIFNPFLTSRNTLFKTPGDKPTGSRAAPTTRAALGPVGFSLGVLKRELPEVKNKLNIQKRLFTSTLHSIADNP
jgi:hypothetical protein